MTLEELTRQVVNLLQDGRTAYVPTADREHFEELLARQVCLLRLTKGVAYWEAVELAGTPTYWAAYSLV